ncbi:hypothetical protein [Burkholderia sp. Bp8998]|uniref:hypothetical protein n=1 Tax=Burkholderia sp. Bp8998 TaxID=2184557 RepID=UPI000F5A10B7|nr:hypothetical protein [Burkholderia sp. Bp8998]
MLLDELACVSSKLTQAGIREAQVSFGWDCNLPIDEMWQDHSVKVDEILEFVCQAERTGVVEIGRGDIFVESQDFRLTLCHEGDAHVAGAADLVRETVERWEQLDYEPYEVKQQP